MPPGAARPSRTYASAESGSCPGPAHCDGAGHARLLKAHELTAEERERIERHPSIAAEILRPIRCAEEIAEIVLCHHECPDGSGYPRRLAAESIPVEARVLRVADVFAALVEPRPYKPRLAASEALARMRVLHGKLDAECLMVLERLVGIDDGAVFGGDHGGC